MPVGGDVGVVGFGADAPLKGRGVGGTARAVLPASFFGPVDRVLLVHAEAFMEVLTFIQTRLSSAFSSRNRASAKVSAAMAISRPSTRMLILNFWLIGYPFPQATSNPTLLALTTDL